MSKSCVDTYVQEQEGSQALGKEHPDDTDKWQDKMVRQLAWEENYLDRYA